MYNRSILSHLKSDEAFPFFIALAAFIVHLAFIGQYDYFRDEFYYVACGQHLAWGYVDHPPLIGVISRITIAIFGKSIFAIRILSVLAGTLVIFTAGLIAKEFGGRRFAMSLASVAVAVAPVNLLLYHFLSMNSFDHLFWSLGLLILIKILKNENPRLWIIFGIILGIGLMNKISVLFIGFGLFAGFLFTGNRRYFLSKWLWISAGIAGLIFLPHIIWQIQNGWPTLEFMHNAATCKNVDMTPVQFLMEHILEIHPLSFPVLALGLGFFFFSAKGKNYRLFGWLFTAIYLLFNLQNAKTYYLAPVYPLMLAGGAVYFESLVERINWNFLKPLYLALLLVTGIIIAPVTLPVLPVEKFIEYQQKMGLSPAVGENHEMGVLPQHYADMFGWREMVVKVSEVYLSLPKEEQSKCAVFGQNYGETGAVDYFRGKYPLPPAISGHNSYWLWGPGNQAIEVLIVIGGNKEDFENVFETVELAAVHSNQYAMPYESNLPIYICRGFKIPLEEIWPHTKSFG